MCVDDHSIMVIVVVQVMLVVLVVVVVPSHQHMHQRVLIMWPSSQRTYHLPEIYQKPPKKTPPHKDTSPQWTYNGSHYGVHIREGGFTIFLLFSHYQVGLDVMQSPPTAQGVFHPVNTRPHWLCPKSENYNRQLLVGLWVSCRNHEGVLYRSG